MKKVTLLTLIVILLCAFSSNMAFAGTKAGETEIGANISLTKPLADDSEGQYMIIANVGYFFTDAIKIGILGMVTGQFEGDNSDPAGYAGATVDYHFNTSGSAVPYVGLGAGAYFFGGENTFSGEGHVGLKQFISERISINYQVGYMKFFDKELEDDGTIQATIGLSFYF